MDLWSRQHRRSSRLVWAMACCWALSACAMNTNPIDDAVQTSALSLAEPSPTIAPDPFVERNPSDGLAIDRMLDEDTMRLAVTTADLSVPQAEGVAWANAATGAKGQIRTITQMETDGQLCRAFTATRQAYDGVALYKGEVCLDRRTGWWTKSLEPVS